MTGVAVNPYPHAVVFGGSGFVGRYVVEALARRDYTVQVICRYPDEAKFLKTLAPVGRITPTRLNIHNIAAIAEAVRKADVVINLIGILQERGRRISFEQMHHQLPDRIARACALHKVERFIHVSALGADEHSTARYARSKALGEEAVFSHLPTATVLRPSLIFGPEDQFFNRFAAMARYSPALPLIGGGKTRFQPVYVGDVAAAVMAAIHRDDTRGRIYELGGPQVYSFRELLQLTLQHSRQKSKLLSIPFCLARLIAAPLSLLPMAPLTLDQVRLLQQDVVVARGAAKLQDLEVTATPLETILPTYLDKYRPGGQWDYAGS